MTKYLKNAKISDNKFRDISYCFAKDFTATQAAKELKLSRQTINTYYKIIRAVLAKHAQCTQVTQNSVSDAYVQARVKKLRGIHKHMLTLHIQEALVRFRYDTYGLYRLILDLFRTQNLTLSSF